jgi:flavin-dependent dehydrogenase
MEKINHGAQGSIFKYIKNSKVYALKRQKISNKKAIELKDKLKKKLIIDDLNNDVLREIYFAKFIKKIPEFIPGIHDTPDGKLSYDKLLLKEYCLDLIYDLKDGDLSKIYNNLNKKMNLFQ